MSIRASYFCLQAVMLCFLGKMSAAAVELPPVGSSDPPFESRYPILIVGGTVTDAAGVL